MEDKLNKAKNFIHQNTKIETSPENSTRDTIQSEISKCLQDIDKKYYSQSFNVMSEIVNVFGDVNWDKVKIDIERLNKIDEKLDKVIKLIVDKHSDEFFKILGFVRQINNMIESSKLKLNEGRDVLRNIHKIISNLSTGENSDWKLKSFYCTEIISKLNKTSNIFKIIQDCEIFVENSKIYDAICLLKKSHREHFEYDKEFRGYNCIVPINMRFDKINDKISSKIIKNLENILFFSAPDVLEKKVSSMLNYFLNSYTKISIDNELTKPLEKFMFVVKNLVTSNLEKYKFDTDQNDLDNYFKENIVDVDAEKKLSSLLYLIKCLKNYDNCFKVFLKFNERIKENLEGLLERTVKVTSDMLKSVDFQKYDLDNKAEKIKFIVFFQIILMIHFHTISKLLSLNVYLKNNNIEDFINKYLSMISKFIVIPLVVYNKMSAPRTSDSLDNINNTGSSNINNSNTASTTLNVESEYIQSESIVRMKMNEILTNNIDNLPIIYKIYHVFSFTANKLYNHKMKVIDDVLDTFTLELFNYYAKKSIPKKFLDIATFLTDYDNEISNFKFIQDFITKINKLKEILTFSFDNGLVELMKIFKEMFQKFYEETKTLIDKIKLECVYNSQFNSLLEEIIKTSDFKEIGVRFEFKKYEKKIIDIQENSLKYKEKVDKEMIKNIINSRNSENVVLITRNYKLMELLSKFVNCTENLLTLGESFILDLMKANFSNVKMTALFEQVSSMHFMDMKAKNTKDLSTMVIINFKVLEKLAFEVSKIIFICKIEFAFLLTKTIKNICNNEYWLHEAQMTPEHFVTAFINDYNMFSSLFQYNFNGSEYDFISSDYMCYVNDLFINCLKTISSNSINNFGISLLIRNFEYIKDKVGQDKFNKEGDFACFSKTIYYFPNYVRLLTLDENSLEQELKRYNEIKPFAEDFIKPILTMRTNTRHTLNETEQKNIIKNVFN